MVTASYRMTVESIRPLSMIPALSRSSALHGGASQSEPEYPNGPYCVPYCHFPAECDFLSPFLCLRLFLLYSTFLFTLFFRIKRALSHRFIYIHL
jgi:hypothetical protein